MENEIMNPIWEEEFNIATYHTDPFGTLKLSSFYELLQDAASRDAARKGFGYNELIAQNKFWVLLRVLVNFKRMPDWEEKVCFRTWPTESNGVIAYRDFELISETGEKLVNGTTTWTQVHTETRRPVRIEMEGKYKPITDLHAILEKPGKVRLPDSLAWSEEIQVKYSQIDVNWHVNNNRYLEWVMNEIPIDYLKNFMVVAMEVNFLSEGKLHDLVKVGFEKQRDDQWLACVRRIEDNRDLYAVKLSFAKREDTFEG